MKRSYGQKKPYTVGCCLVFECNESTDTIREKQLRQRTNERNRKETERQKKKKKKKKCTEGKKKVYDQ